MLGDMLQFAAMFLVDEGRLSLWMPTANDEDLELGIPSHPALDLVAVCVQVFSKCRCQHTPGSVLYSVCFMQGREGF